MKRQGNLNTGKSYVPFDAEQQVGVTCKFLKEPEETIFNCMICK